MEQLSVKKFSLHLMFLLVRARKTKLQKEMSGTGIVQPGPITQDLDRPATHKKDPTPRSETEFTKLRSFREQAIEPGLNREKTK